MLKTESLSPAVFVLALLALTCLVSWGAEPAVRPAVAVKRIDVEQFEKLRTKTNAVILDVRSKAEFEKGRIPGAINLDINSTRFAEKVDALDRSKTYLVHCAVGMRSARACKKMESMGFKELYDLAPGFDGWKKADKTVEK